MFHDDDTLNLLETYRKNKYKEKTNGKFSTKLKNDYGVPRFIWITIVIFMGYLIITNLNKIDTTTNEALKTNNLKQNPVIERTLIQTTQVVEKPQTITTKNIEIISNKPIITPPKIEKSKQETTINLTPQQTIQKQAPIKKVEEEEEIHPGSSTSVGYYR